MRRVGALHIANPVSLPTLQLHVEGTHEPSMRKSSHGQPSVDDLLFGHLLSEYGQPFEMPTSGALRVGALLPSACKVDHFT